MITKSAYHYEVHCTLDNEEKEIHFNSFSPLSRAMLMAQVIGDSETINISHFQYEEANVVVGVEDDDFLQLATVVSKKSRKKNAEEDN